MPIILFCAALSVFGAGRSGAAEDPASEGERCSGSSSILTPIYYAPGSPTAALAAARGQKPPPGSALGLLFKMQGEEPCREHECRLQVFDNEGKRLIASVNLDRRDATFCREVKLMEGEGASPPCNGREVVVFNRIKLEGDDADPALDNTLIQITYEYYISIERNSSKNVSYKCVYSGIYDAPRARIGSWKITSNLGSVTTIVETDILNKSASVGDFDRSKLSVTVQNADQPAE